MPHSMPPFLKTCTICGATKLSVEFHPTLRSPDGRVARCKTCDKALNAAWKAANPDRLNALRRVHSRAWQQRNPEKTRAHKTVAAAVKAGILIRPSTCPQCGSAGRIEAHHGDYSKPLDVQWLCRLCHASLSRREQSDAA